MLEYINPQIKCPWCGAKYSKIRNNGHYIRDNNKIPQYYCKLCKRAFSFSIIKIDILKPPTDPRENIEAGVNHFLKGLGIFKGNIRLALGAYNLAAMLLRINKGVELKE